MYIQKHLTLSSQWQSVAVYDIRGATCISDAFILDKYWILWQNLRQAGLSKENQHFSMFIAFYILFGRVLQTKDLELEIKWNKASTWTLSITLPFQLLALIYWYLVSSNLQVAVWISSIKKTGSTFPIFTQKGENNQTTTIETKLVWRLQQQQQHICTS